MVELPAEAKKHTKAGAVAFNEFYWKQAGEALKTGDPDFLTVYSEGCAVCDNVVEQIRSSEEKGTRMSVNPYSVRNASGRARSDSGYRVELTVDIKEYHEVLKDGSRGKSASAQSITVVSDTRWADGHWEIRDQVRTK